MSTVPHRTDVEGPHPTMICTCRRRRKAQTCRPFYDFITSEVLYQLSYVGAGAILVRPNAIGRFMLGLSAWPSQSSARIAQRS
jgi:hypothetical protein